MPQKKPNFDTILEQTGDALTPEEQAAAEAEARGEAPVEAAPEQPQEVAPETPEQPQPKGGKSKQKDSEFVPRTRLNEVGQERDAARAEAQRAATEAAELREKWARLEERQRMATEAQQRAQQAAADEQRRASRPDPDVDPAGARAWDAEQKAIALESQVAQLTQFVNTRSNELQGWTQQQQMAGFAQQTANVGRTRFPDWDSRVDFARAERAKFWVSVGHSEENARQIVANEEMALLRSAVMTGADLVTAVANMTSQWGYKPATSTNGNGNGNGSVKLDQIQAGQRVQGLGRTQSAEAPSQKQWQAMEDVEFANFIVGLPDGTFMEMSKDKQFQRRVSELDLKGAA